MLTKRSVSLEELAEGKKAYLTRNYCTYLVRYVRGDEKTSRVYVEVVCCILVHRKPHSPRWILRPGDELKILPGRLFLVENKRDPFWKRIANLLRKKND